MTDLLFYLRPYHFSVFTVIFFVVVAFWYLRGIRQLRTQGCPPHPARRFSFWLGLGLCYVVLHTRFDYFAQYVFFMHRLQHLVLHHVGAALIALANPLAVFRAGAPARFTRDHPLVRVLRPGVRVLQNPVVATVVFVGLIYFWLIPSVHFAAMLSQTRYMIMNWSMFIDGVLFWLLILDARPPAETEHMPRHGTRFAMLWAATFPQIVLGAWITFRSGTLYGFYAMCGRPWPISLHRDQVLGGLLTWIPPGMMAVIGSLLVLHMLLRDDEARYSREGGTHG